MIRYFNYFNDVEVGAQFVCNGALYVKQSTRTAKILSGAGCGQWFYFGKFELCQLSGVDYV